jgi:hypothetical protein
MNGFSTDCLKGRAERNRLTELLVKCKEAIDSRIEPDLLEEINKTMLDLRN